MKTKRILLLILTALTLVVPEILAAKSAKVVLYRRKIVPILFCNLAARI